VPQVLPTQRYKEGNDIAIRSGAEAVAITEDNAAQDGTLDVSLAELSLGQRLASTSKSDKSGTLDHPHLQLHEHKGENAPREAFILKADVPTLTRTLTQALHSNDTPLLESVLANSSRQLIAGTVQRLQPQYALPLIMACVERMNRGARAGRGKGRGGGASAQRAELMVRWIRAVLVAHTAHLLTLPDLVSRLSALHTSLTQRLALQDRLLALNGRLDLVLSQIEQRAAIGPPAPVPAPQSSKARKRKARKERKRTEAFKYVEGESSDEAGEPNAMDVDPNDEDEEAEMDGDVGETEDEGSIEEVELGASDSVPDDDDEADDDSNEDDEGEDDEDESPHINGFLDIEAEESSGEGESSSEESNE
jgi:U3 small nucleolar RNA-associated protein 5